ESLPNLARLWRSDSRIEMPPPFQFSDERFRDWRLSIVCATDPPDGLREGTHFARVAGTLAGTSRRPVFVGEAEFEDVDVSSGEAVISADANDPEDDVGAIHVRRVLLTFSAYRPRYPSVLLEVRGSYLETPYSAMAIGPLDHLIRVYESNPPMTDGSVRDLLAGTLPQPPERFSLEVHPPIAADVIIAHWLINQPTPEAAVPADQSTNSMVPN
ncbi:MAG: hypothetical protein ABI680_15100, partial [Chthoniobacteraceae bacterium]